MLDASGATYTAVTPARIMDTRTGVGVSTKLTNGVAKSFQVAGQGGVPANAVAVTGNLTVTLQTTPGYLYLGPVATNTPTSSTLNFPKADNRANGVTVALRPSDPGGAGLLGITFVSGTGATADAIFDVTGYFMPNASGATYVPLTPARILDTRAGNGLPTKLTNHAGALFTAAGRGFVPANAVAVTGNLTVTLQTTPGTSTSARWRRTTRPARRSTSPRPTTAPTASPWPWAARASRHHLRLRHGRGDHPGDLRRDGGVRPVAAARAVPGWRRPRHLP